MAAAGRQGPHQRVSADRADVGSDPARMGSTATPVYGSAQTPGYDDLTAAPVAGGYLLNGRELWATNGTIRISRCDGEGAEE